jgi:hypothetical protein
MERDYWQPSILWGMSTRCFDTMWIVNIFFLGWGGSSPNMSDFIRSHVLTNVYQVLILCELCELLLFWGNFMEHLLLHLVWYFEKMVTSYFEVFILSSFFGIFMELVLFPFGPIFWGRLARRYCETSWNFMKHFSIVVMVVGLSFFHVGEESHFVTI